MGMTCVESWLSFLRDPTLNTSPKPHLQKMSCRHPCRIKTNKVKFTFSVNDTYMGDLQLVLSKTNRIDDIKYHI